MAPRPSDKSLGYYQSTLRVASIEVSRPRPRDCPDASPVRSATRFSPRGPFPACLSARSSLLMVGTLGMCFPVSIRQSVSTRTPARFARSRWLKPAATRSRMIFRAKLARAYSTAG